MSTEFTPIFVFILLAIFGIATGMIVISHVFSPRRNTAVKQMPYESGMDPIGDARQRFDVRYYLIAIAFLLFDVELLYLYPWAVAQWTDRGVQVTATSGAVVNEEGPPVTPPEIIATPVPAPVAFASVGIPPAFRNLVFGEILVFIAVLVAAYAYAWRKGVFEWR
jgi:NADH-quinone oxidoreductase subunit A